jgi:hypothetical protein
VIYPDDTYAIKGLTNSAGPLRYLIDGLIVEPFSAYNLELCVEFAIFYAKERFDCGDVIADVAAFSWYIHRNGEKDGVIRFWLSTGRQHLPQHCYRGLADGVDKPIKRGSVEANARVGEAIQAKAAPDSNAPDPAEQYRREVAYLDRLEEERNRQWTTFTQDEQDRLISDRQQHWKQAGDWPKYQNMEKDRRREQAIREVMTGLVPAN